MCCIEEREREMDEKLRNEANDGMDVVVSSSYFNYFFYFVLLFFSVHSDLPMISLLLIVEYVLLRFL